MSLVLRFLPAVIEFKWPRQDDLPDGWPLEAFMRLYSPELTVYHESFLEFLTDRNISGKFYVDEEGAYEEMTDCLDIIVADRLEYSAWYGIQTFLVLDLHCPFTVSKYPGSIDRHGSL